jgi:hypothetical protein
LKSKRWYRKLSSGSSNSSKPSSPQTLANLFYDVLADSNRWHRFVIFSEFRSD